ncbi:MAG TPA: TlpA disulfide reductase family protein [bacterium]|nr:TlpA disulfide reductase family protein [bacterium]HMY34742.1 TlpA disulfide reductase family protein [bacterium]HMZ03081.1 TlpA disulfide reductase family protein [bacterium]HNB08157.1 TlpA disulfide reductase family protein [bacterium]HNC47534.1 TlpA disulfide reductase family protein [bacterium]
MDKNSMTIKPGLAAPELRISEWIQGTPIQLSELQGRVVIIEVFQVNCPGCFLYGLPEILEIAAKHKNEPLTVIGLATAFEDFDINTKDNLQKLLQTGELVGETARVLKEHDWATDNKLRYTIPIPVAMDRLGEGSRLDTVSQIERIIERDITNFDRLSYGEQGRIRESILKYLNERTLVPETFDLYNLSGTPSSIVIDKKGILRHIQFGSTGNLEKIIRPLLTE